LDKLLDAPRSTVKLCLSQLKQEGFLVLCGEGRESYYEKGNA